MSKFIVLTSILVLLSACGPSAQKQPAKNMEPLQVVRKGWVIKVKPEKLEEYKSLHANPWEVVNTQLKECNIQNYSIFYRDGYLFSYLEYTGDDWERDMAKMAADSITQEWWKLTDPCQEPLESAAEGEWWADMEEIYHLD
jgi:L-rhamnose mutarotase